MSKYITDQKTVKTNRDLRWVALSWLDGFFLIMLMATMNIPLIPLAILGIAAAFFFLIGLATLLNPSAKYCSTCEDIFDNDLEECPVCQAKLTTAPVPLRPKTKQQKMQTTEPHHTGDEDVTPRDHPPL